MSYDQDKPSEIIAFLIKNLSPSQLQEFANCGNVTEAFQVVSAAGKAQELGILVHNLGMQLDTNAMLEAIRNYVGTRQNLEPYEFLCQVLVERHGKDCAQKFAHTSHPWDTLLDENEPKELAAAIAECLLETISAKHLQRVALARFDKKNCGQGSSQER